MSLLETETPASHPAPASHSSTVEPRNPRGMRDLDPALMLERERVVDIIRGVYQTSRWGVLDQSIRIAAPGWNFRPANCELTVILAAIENRKDGLATVQKDFRPTIRGYDYAPRDFIDYALR